MLGVTQGIKINGDNVWGDSLEGVAMDEYSKDAPKAYVEMEKPKINYALI